LSTDVIFLIFSVLIGLTFCFNQAITNLTFLGLFISQINGFEIFALINNTIFTFDMIFKVIMGTLRKLLRNGT